MNLDESGSNLDESGLAGAHPLNLTYTETYTMFPWKEGSEGIVWFEGSVETRVLVPRVSFAPVSLLRLFRFFKFSIV